jgi:hypothetical protein
MRTVAGGFDPDRSFSSGELVCSLRDQLSPGHCRFGACKAEKFTLFSQGGAKRAGLVAQPATVLPRSLKLGKCRIVHSGIGSKPAGSCIWLG